MTSKFRIANLGLGSKQQPSTNAVLSINVNQVIAPTFDNQCMINKNDDMQQNAAKKKRTALENLTNNGSTMQQQSTLTSVCDNTTSGVTHCSKDSKKAKPTVFSGTNKLKKADSLTSNVTKKMTTLTKKSNSKENLGVYVPPTRNASKLPINTKSKPPQVKMQPLGESNTKLSKSANSILSIKPEATKASSNAQILEPQMQFADSTEQLSGSSSSLNSISMETGRNETAPSAQELKNILRAELVEGWEDIDCDDHDEFSCSDYVAQIFKYYREREDKFIVDDYLKRQPHINKQMRLLLVDWMVEVQQQLEFNHEVLYLSVKLLDLYLNKRRIEKEKLQLLGGAAMFIACKFEERMPPIIDDFIYVSDNAYDRNELIKMEIDILKTVKFDIGVPLSYTFLRRYSKCIKADMRFLTLARYILELSLQDYNFAHVRDSEKACAALYLAMKMTVAYEDNIKNILETNPDCLPLEQLTVSYANLTSTEWNATLIHYTGCFLSDFVHLLPGMNNLIKTSALSKYKTIFKKYSHQVFYEVAKISPLSDASIDALITLNTSQNQQS